MDSPEPVPKRLRLTPMATSQTPLAAASHSPHSIAPAQPVDGEGGDPDIIAFFAQRGGRAKQLEQQVAELQAKQRSVERQLEQRDAAIKRLQVRPGQARKYPTLAPLKWGCST